MKQPRVTHGNREALQLLLQYYVSLGQRWYGALTGIVLGVLPRRL